MSLHPDPIGPVPEETARMARAAFRKEIFVFGYVTFWERSM